MKKHVLASMIAATSIGFFAPLTCHAFGLGKIEVMSALNEPFKAEIGLTALRPEEKDNLQVKIASDEEFAKAGLNRSLLLSQMQFDIVERGGQDRILVTSKQSIKEPFLDFLVTATAGSGILIREYTVLLDPPEYVMAEARAVTSSPAPQATEAVDSEPTTTRYQYAQSSGFSGSSYDVKRSDTLWNVALQTRPASDISVHQMMMALFNTNPDAFANRNVNELKAGVTLQIPSRNEIQSLSESAARQAFAEQNEAWKNRNRTAAATVTQVEPEATTETASEEAAPTTEQTAGTETAAAGEASTEADARLQLVAAEDDATSEDDASPNVAGNDEIKRLTEQLTLAQETIEAQAQENIDFKARMDAMEEQLETMRRLISLKDADLARLQSMLEEEDPALAAEAAAALESDETTVATETSQTEAAGTDVADATNTTVETATDGQQAEDAMLQEQAETGDDNLISSAAKALNLDQAQVQSTADKVKQFVADNKMPTALGLLLILLIFWLLARRSSREVTWDEAVKKLDKDSNKQSSAAVVAPVHKDDVTDAPLADEQPLEEKSVGELVEQADMFVGYADYVQARSSLEQARNLEPDNTLVAYKMLFVLYKQNQADEFVELAEQTPFEKDSFEWDEVKQWGRELVPGHALFADKPTPQADDTAEQVEAPAFADEPQTTEDIVDTETAQDDHIEFDLGDFAEPGSQQNAEEAENEVPPKPKDEVDDDLLAFDTNYSRDEKAETVDNDEETSELDISDSDDTLSFEDETKSAPAGMDSDDVEETDLNADADAPDLEFDIDDLDDIDEAETKLDLAAAYIDMGDPDGARSILNEVLVEGNDAQKNRAHELLNSLS